MLYLFLIGFVAIGVCSVVKGIRLRINLQKMHLDPESDDYADIRKKATGYIWGGILLALVCVEIWIEVFVQLKPR